MNLQNPYKSIEIHIVENITFLLFQVYTFYNIPLQKDIICQQKPTRLTIKINANLKVLYLIKKGPHCLYTTTEVAF